jgi:phospholipase/carboxylesterase
MHYAQFRMKAVQESPTQPEIHVESGVFAQSSQDSPHALFAPMHYERGYAYPLIVWLHGPGSDESQLLRIMPAVSARNYVAVAPRGTAVPAGDEGVLRHVWDWREGNLEESLQRVFDCIDLAARKFHVSHRRVFIAGFGRGGATAFRIAMTRPDRFAGTLSLCGGIARGGALLGNLPMARRLPVFLTAGRTSRDYGAAEVCEDLRLLHAAGMSVTLRQYPCGQELSAQMLRDVDRWLIEQITAERSAETTPVDRQSA